MTFGRIVQPVQEDVPSAAGVRLDDSDDRFGMMLRRHAVDERACTFLRFDGDERKRCGIYRDRPVVCDVYPFELRDDAAALRGDVRCLRDDWNLATVDFGARRATLGRYAAEWAAAERIAARWNACAAPGDVATAFDAYLRYAHAVAGAVLGAPGDDAALARWDEPRLPPDVSAAQRRWLDQVDAAIAAGAHRVGLGD